MLSRRNLLEGYLGAAARLTLGTSAAASGATRAGESAGQAPLSREDDQFLEDLEKANFLFFWEQEVRFFEVFQKLRSEEHTSELQSHLNLVCRLLLEKKNISHT